MRPPEEVERVRELARGGLNNCQIARITGVNRRTISDWVSGRTRHPRIGACPACGHGAHDFSALPPASYAYLLGIYLGDGTISKAPRGVWTLRIFQDARYTNIVDEIVRAVGAVMPKNRIGVFEKHPGTCFQITCNSKSWPCLIPQAGPGRKHERKIELTAWQWAYVWQEPGMFIRGLIHSDGCRVTNKVWGGKYEYPRYFFTNHSLDIQQLFKDACDLIGVEYKNNNWYDISVARRDSVALLDEIVGPKT